MRSLAIHGWRIRRNVAVASVCLSVFFLGEQSAAHPEGKREIQASSEFADFIRAVAAPTALAETQPGNFVKFLRLGKNREGEVVVLGIALLPLNEHASAELDEGAEVLAIAHVHHKLMSQAPAMDDAVTVRGLGVPNFVISFDGRAIWEVGVVAGQDMYRQIDTEKPGEWKVLE